MGFSGIPIVNVENACASSTTGLNQAAAALKAGIADVALVAGAEKMFFPEKRREMFEAFIGGTDVHLMDETLARLAMLGAGMAPPQGAAETDAAERSFFMDIYASFARQHMKAFGTTARQIAAAAAKNHRHSTLNPLAQYRHDMTVDEVLADKPIVWPLTRAMCAPMSDGAAALVLCSGEALRRFGVARAIKLRASVLVSSGDREPGDYARHTSRLAAAKAYDQAGVGPGDIDLAEVHDATAFAEILQFENLGFCERGQGGWCAERGETALGGRLPVNSSGGLVSKGHPIGATGAAMVHEIVTQLRHEAGARQVAGAQLGLVENGGGFWGVEEAATTVTILERAQLA
jgi:acetyl-CoA acetyltransferase